MPPDEKLGWSCQILNQTAPLPSKVAALVPAGTFARYARAGPWWKMAGLEVKAEKGGERDS